MRVVGGGTDPRCQASQPPQWEAKAHRQVISAALPLALVGTRRGWWLVVVCFCLSLLLLCCAHGLRGLWVPPTSVAYVRVSNARYSSYLRSKSLWLRLRHKNKLH